MVYLGGMKYGWKTNTETAMLSKLTDRVLNLSLVGGKINQWTMWFISYLWEQWTQKVDRFRNYCHSVKNFDAIDFKEHIYIEDI